MRCHVRAPPRGCPELLASHKLDIWNTDVLVQEAREHFGNVICDAQPSVIVTLFCGTLFVEATEPRPTPLHRAVLLDDTSDDDMMQKPRNSPPGCLEENCTDPIRAQPAIPIQPHEGHVNVMERWPKTFLQKSSPLSVTRTAKTLE